MKRMEEKLPKFHLVLAPFQPRTRIELQTYPNRTCSCFLELQNVTNKDLNVTITRAPCTSRRLIFQLPRTLVKANSSSRIAIKWSPIEFGCWQDILQLTDSRRMKYDITIVTKALAKSVKKSFSQSRTLKQSVKAALRSDPKPKLKQLTANKENIGQLNMAHQVREDGRRDTYVITGKNINYQKKDSHNVEQPVDHFFKFQSTELTSLNLSEDLEDSLDDSLEPKSQTEFSMVINRIVLEDITSTPLVNHHKKFKENFESELSLDNDSPETAHGSTYCVKELIFTSPHEKDCNQCEGKTKEKLRKQVHLNISPPKKSLSAKIIPMKKVSPKKHRKILKGKKDGPAERDFSSRTLRNKISHLSNVGLCKFEVHKPTISNSQKGLDAEDFYTQLCNMSSFARKNRIHDITVYSDKKWICDQENGFKKWLNALLCTTEEERSTDIQYIDYRNIGKIWQSCGNKDKTGITFVDIKSESVSTRISTLRKAAYAMYRERAVDWILSRTMVCIDKGIFRIRGDRDLRRDVGLQREILEVLLSYNPLWLRIGLETVYDETIPINTDDDVVALSKFLRLRFFSDPSLRSKDPRIYTDLLQKLLLKRFFRLVYFLDYAKTHRLIRRDPCLFRRSSKLKSSRAIVLSFARRLLAGMGDVTIILRSHGYVLSHTQSLLDEFDFAVKDLRTDLRDGIRLCRLLELISPFRHLTSFCKVPANSRLQKIHNVDIFLQSLRALGFTIEKVSSKDIADGRREYILLLLWQIVYKFQAPMLEKSAKKIQSWWRRVWFIESIKRVGRKRIKAATIIQRFWRETLKKRKEKREFEIRIFQTSKERIKMVNAASIIQRNWRKMKYSQSDRNRFLKIRVSVLIIQRYWRRFLQMQECRQDFLEIKRSALIIQKCWRQYKASQKIREQFLEKKRAALTIQRSWRRVREMSREAQEKCESSTDPPKSVIESSIEETKNQETECPSKSEVQFRKICNAVILIQSIWRGYRVRRLQSSRMSELRERLKEAAKAATPSATLGYRWQQAVTMFQCSNSAGQLLLCLTSLDTITRLSPIECLMLCQLNLVEKIYETLTQSNRSLPWLKICLRSSSILITLAQYYRTKDYVLQKEYALTIAKLMNSTLEHEELFRHLATLFWLLCEDESYRVAITSPQISWLLKSLRNKVKNRKDKKSDPNILPSLKPDWGIKRKEERIFPNVQSAITAIVSRMNID